MTACKCHVCRKSVSCPECIEDAKVIRGEIENCVPAYCRHIDIHNPNYKPSEIIKLEIEQKQIEFLEDLIKRWKMMKLPRFKPIKEVESLADIGGLEALKKNKKISLMR